MQQMYLTVPPLIWDVEIYIFIIILTPNFPRKWI